MSAIPKSQRVGLGDVSDDRMAKAIEIIVKAKELPRTPATAEVFRSQLPAARERATDFDPRRHIATFMLFVRLLSTSRG